MWWFWWEQTYVQVSATGRESMTTCIHFHTYCSFLCYFDAYMVCILGSRKQSHLCLNLFLCMATLKYVLSLITPVEGYGQDIHWFLNTDSGTRKKCLGFSGFHFCLFESFGFQQVLCLCFTGWSRCQRCQRPSWRPRSKGTLYSTLHLTDAQVLGFISAARKAWNEFQIVSDVAKEKA